MTPRGRLSLVVGSALVIVLAEAAGTYVRASQPSSSPKPGASCQAGYVALTFDDGPGPATPTVLAALKSVGVRATFFDVA